MTEFVRSTSEETEEAVHSLLNSLHEYAATAKLEEYFSLFHPKGKFLGTDGTENWTADEFKEWAKPFFIDVDCAWEYHPLPNQRYVSIQKSSGNLPTYAVFDEVLYCCDLKCHTRGSGTLVYENQKWYLMLYHITFPIPDKLNRTVTSRIMQGKKLMHQKDEMQRKEAEASAVAEQFLQELELEDNAPASKSQNSKSNKSKKKSKKH